MPILRVLIEVLHVVAGVLAALLIGGAAAWAYPVGKANIWLVTYVSIGVVVLLGIRPVLRAARGNAHE
ncbi:hypothetical protein [Sphingomonas sp. Y38-1Y]|jgi:hypothetical protein|uniref:hypothetical protein n=1 Tax=Sphingomonas sp. Y38-1Y TaxID=3078265 RepID=UPI0028E70D4B|nr:hypothetical protein [Sphingomonas sp. Y38-1Y]